MSQTPTYSIVIVNGTTNTIDNAMFASGNLNQSEDISSQHKGDSLFCPTPTA